MRFGMVGTGYIAKLFTEAMQEVDEGELVAVASRTQEKADAFGERFSIPGRYEGLSSMLVDADLDVLYVATPNSNHLKEVSMALQSGVNVLCEKPMGLNTAEVKEMAGLAREKGLFLMEAMWTRFFPVIHKVRKWISDGEIGDVTITDVHFCIDSGFLSDRWRYQADKGGGALLDVGIYCIALLSMVYGKMPLLTKSFAQVQNGIDMSSVVLLQYSDTQYGMMASGFNTKSHQMAHISGTKGRIVISEPFWRPTRVELHKAASSNVYDFTCVEVFEEPYASTGYQYEIRSVMDCIKEGKKECGIVPLDESIEIAQLMEDLRREWKMNV